MLISLRQNKVKVSVRARPRIDMHEVRRTFNRLVKSATVGRLTPEEFNRNVEKAKKIDPNDESYQAEMILAQVMYHKDWLIFNEERHKMRLAWAEFFREYDLLLCPIANTTAFPHNHDGERWERMVMVNGKPQPSTTQVFWAGYSGLAYLPSTVAPTGLASDGLPVGILIVGPQYGDYTCIHFANLLEKEFQGFIPPDGFE